MGKTLKELAAFLINNCDKCSYKQGVAIINKGSLSLQFTSEKISPEYVKIEVKKFLIDSRGNHRINLIASQTFETDALKDLINSFWRKVALKSSEVFIEKYGLEKYDFYVSAYLSALEGIKEDANFIFKRKLDSDYLTLLVKNKFNTNPSDGGNSISIPLHNSFNDFQHSIHSSLILEVIVPCKDNESYMPTNITICIPSINLDEKYNHNNDLKLSTKIRYSQDNIVDYISSQFTSKEESSLLLNFTLQNDLSENNKNTKKLKI